MSLSRKVVSRPVLAVIVFALVGIVGLYTIADLAIDLFPDVERPFLSVGASYSGASPESVEREVTEPLESALVNVSGLKQLTSSSNEGSSRLSLEFEYGVNLDEAINDIRDKLDRVQRTLPEEVDKPYIYKFDANQWPIMRIALRGNRPPEDLRSLGESIVKSRLEQLDGVAEASVTGGRSPIVRVELSQNRLDAYNLTITGVAQALAAHNLELGAGSIEEEDRAYNVRTMGGFQSLEDIANAQVAVRNGYRVRLADLGTVELGLSEKTSAVYINGESGVYIQIQKQSGTNSVKVADAIYTRLEDIKAVLPADVTLEIISDDTEQIRATISTLVSSALQGFLLAIAILFLFLRSLKSTLIIGISIPFSILVTMLAMHLAGITLNMMTLTGLILGVGMIVDASIVIIENIWQYRERGAKPHISAILGTDEMLKSVVAGNLTTICVFLPIIFFKGRLGMTGQMAQDMIFTIVIALFSSLLVALFLVPVLAGKWIPLETRREKPLKNRFVIALDRGLEGVLSFITRIYRFVLCGALRHRLTTILIVIGALGITAAALPRMSIYLMPGMADASVELSISLPIGTTLDKTEAIVREMEQVVLSEVEGWKSIIANAGSGRGPSGSYRGSISIQLPEADQQIDTIATIQEKLRPHFDRFPEARFNFGMDRRRQMQGGADIDIALRSNDIAGSLKTANDIAELLKTAVPGLDEPSIDLTEGLPQVEVIIDRDRAYALGVNVATAARELNAALNGTTATTWRSEGNDYAVSLMLAEADRSRVIDLERIFVSGAAGRVALANFARLDQGLGPVSIRRENQTRIIHVTANILTDEKANVMEGRIQEAIAQNLVIPDTVSVSYEGSWKEVSDTGKTFALIITMAILLVFGVMAGQYESFKDPFINLFTIPLMFIGVIAIHLVTGSPITMFTAVGIVMLAGIVVNNGIILVDYTNLLVRRGMSVGEACLEAGISRLRPVLMTTLTTILGMIPMAFFGGSNAMMIQPIGLTVVGGLASATFITLFFIPVLYSLFNGGKKKKEMADGEEKALCEE